MEWVLITIAAAFTGVAALLLLAWLRSRRCPACGGWQRAVGMASVPVEGFLKTYHWPILQCRRCGRKEYPPASVRLGERAGRGRLSDPDPPSGA